MNRIILIGNGFDLAHGLPTRYEDFINWYWEQWVINLSKCPSDTLSDNLCSFSIKSGRGNWSMYMYQLGYASYKLNGYDIIDIIDKIIANKSQFQVSLSPLLSHIRKSIKEKNWVDIEREYYDLLRNAVLAPDRCDYSVKELNIHLHYLQGLLTNYLSLINYNKNIIDKFQCKIYSPLKKKDVSVPQLNTYCDYVSMLLYDDEQYQVLLNRYDFDMSDVRSIHGLFNRLRINRDKPLETDEVSLDKVIFPENILLLNYTRVADKYGDKKVATVNHIHGSLENPESMIFGYGDELDDNYNDLLKQTDNDCLMNIKSIKYLGADNYRNLLRFIESAPYQVYIMGHSCGNSDRTLLNTLFEHKNCVSIKPFYYKKEDGSDNYMEIVQNICRNFTDMKLMRDRVVNKTFCEPLPQISR